jgi:hypothetical protein
MLFKWGRGTNATSTLVIVLLESSKEIGGGRELASHRNV